MPHAQRYRRLTQKAGRIRVHFTIDVKRAITGFEQYLIVQVLSENRQYFYTFRLRMTARTMRMSFLNPTGKCIEDLVNA